jgi:hypothetical protein
MAASLVVLASLACNLTNPTPAAWALTPTARSQAQTATAYAADQVNTLQSPNLVPPTPTPTPPLATLTPTPPANGLSKSGPWLVYPAEAGQGLVAFNPDGSQPTRIALPDLVDNSDLADGLSPTGGYLVVRAGLPGSPEGLGLYLLQFPEGRLQKLTSLLTPAIEQQAKANPAELPDVIRAALAPHALSWSPDGRYLAFIGAVDGLSTDLYVYDLRQHQITRLTSGSNQAAIPFWAPDDLWIITQEMEHYTSQGWKVSAVYAASVFNSKIFKLYSPPEASQGEVFLGWTQPLALVAYSKSPDGGFGLRQVEIEKLIEHPIFSGPFQELAYDPQSHNLLVRLSMPPQDDLDLPTPGIFMRSLEDPVLHLVNSGDWAGLNWQPAEQRFAAHGSQGALFVSVTKGTLILPGEGQATFSPNGTWLAAWDAGLPGVPAGIRLYQGAGQLLQTIATGAVSFLAWQPGSGGFFYISGGHLGLVTFPGLQSTTLENIPALHSGYTPVWVPSSK